MAIDAAALGGRTGADLEAARQARQLRPHWVSSYADRATGGRTFGGQDVHPLHHAEILMVEDMAMRDKAAHGDRIEIRPKRDRSRRCEIDVRRTGWWTSWHGDVGLPGGHMAAGTSKVSCHSGSGRVIPFIFVIST